MRTRLLLPLLFASLLSALAGCADPPPVTPAEKSGSEQARIDPASGAAAAAAAPKPIRVKGIDCALGQEHVEVLQWAWPSGTEAFEGSHSFDVPTKTLELKGTLDEGTWAGQWTLQIRGPANEESLAAGATGFRALGAGYKTGNAPADWKAELPPEGAYTISWSAAGAVTGFTVGITATRCP